MADDLPTSNNSQKMEPRCAESGLKVNSRWSVGDFSNGLAAYFGTYPVAMVLTFAFLPLLALCFNKKMWQHSAANSETWDRNWLRGAKPAAAKAASTQKAPSNAGFSQTAGRSRRNQAGKRRLQSSKWRWDGTSRALLIVALFGLIHFAAYSSLHVPPYHWYYVPVVTCIVLLGSFALGVAYRTFREGVWPQRLLRAVLVVYLAAPVSGMFCLLAREHFVVKEMPIHTNWASQEQYREIGLWLKEHHKEDRVVLPNEVGTIAYYSDCYLLNQFSDRYWLKSYLGTMPPGFKKTLLRINYSFSREAPSVSPCSYLLIKDDAHVAADRAQKQWEISSRWIPHSTLVFMRIEWSPMILEMMSRVGDRSGPSKQ